MCMCISMYDACVCTCSCLCMWRSGNNIRCQSLFVWDNVLPPCLFETISICCWLLRTIKLKNFWRLSSLHLPSQHKNTAVIDWLPISALDGIWRFILAYESSCLHSKFSAYWVISPAQKINSDQVTAHIQEDSKQRSLGEKGASDLLMKNSRGRKAVLSKWQNGMCCLDHTIEGNRVKVPEAKEKGLFEMQLWKIFYLLVWQHI